MPMFWRALRVAFTCGVVAAVAATACGGSSSSSGEPGAGAGGTSAGGSGHGGAGRSSGGAGKAGATGTPTPVPCGDEMCAGISVPLAQLEVPGCCADAKTNTCGIDTSALPAMASGQGLPACQPVAPAGKPDATCPSSASIQVMGIAVTAPGCCTPTGVCGYDLDRVGGFISLGLGCLDSTSFADGGTPVTCGPNAAGEGGMGGAGPAPIGDGGMAGSDASGAPGH
jgi:hypothetical protein